jgi:glycosyltransferase involved in cell wall biosynthesis
MPPARTGVANYAADLLQVLRTRGSVELFPDSADVNLYHLGNNQLHAAIYRRALEQPGVVVLHDAVMHHFALGCFSREEYVFEFVRNYGEWSRSTAEELWRNRARSASDPRYYRYPMIRRIVESSRAVVVHNPAAARIVRDHVPAARVIEIPHLYRPRPAPDAAEVLKLREHLGFEPSDFVCGIFGHLRPSKRIESVAQACRRTGVKLLIAGACPRDLERALGPVLGASFVRRAPYGELRSFHRLTFTVDACANLRYPAAGETSGIGIELMGIGKPVITSEGEEVSRYSEGTCVKVPHGPAETDAVAHVLAWLNRYRCDAESIGARAARHIASEHDPERAAELYWKVLQQ